MAGYPSRQEFFALGLPARAFARQPVMVSAVDAAADALTVRAHGLSNGDRVRLELTPTIPGATPSADASKAIVLKPRFLIFSFLTNA